MATAKKTSPKSTGYTYGHQASFMSQLSDAYSTVRDGSYNHSKHHAYATPASVSEKAPMLPESRWHNVKRLFRCLFTTPHLNGTVANNNGNNNNNHDTMRQTLTATTSNDTNVLPVKTSQSSNLHQQRVPLSVICQAEVQVASDDAEILGHDRKSILLRFSRNFVILKTTITPFQQLSQSHIESTLFHLDDTKLLTLRMGSSSIKLRLDGSCEPVLEHVQTLITKQNARKYEERAEEVYATLNVSQEVQDVNQDAVVIL